MAITKTEMKAPTIATSISGLAADSGNHYYVVSVHAFIDGVY